MMKRKFMQRQVQKLKTSNITKTSTNGHVFNKSLLRYPGGKTRGAEKIFKKFIQPQNPKSICSPFFGGGSLEILCANNNIEVFGYDNFKPLVDFWQCVLKCPFHLAQKVAMYWVPHHNGLPKKPFGISYTEFKKLIHEYNLKLDRAALFYVVNRTSFSGSTLSGGRTAGNPRFTENSIKNILDFKTENNTKKLHIKKLDFTKSLKKHKMMMYLDPPYWNANRMYGKNGTNRFSEADHIKLAKILKRTKSKWVLSYNDNKKVKKLYPKSEGFHIFNNIHWVYGMNNVNSVTKKKSDEIIITNFDI